MLLNNNSLIMQWNRDENGNPMSWHIPLEVQQISPTHGVVQLVQVPDQHQRVKIVTEENVQLNEVYNVTDITFDSFYVDYGVGIIRFHESQKGKMVRIDYHGRGVILISDSRIFHRDGENITDTWDNILARSQDALDLIESAGGLVNAMKEIDEKVAEGKATADRLENFITETQFYGYTITLSREAFVVKAKEDGEVGKTEVQSVYTDVIVYQGAKQIIPVLSMEQEQGCAFKIEGQRVKLTSMDINVIKASAVLNIDCGDGLVAQRKLEVTKVFDGVSQYSVEMTNPFYSFEANSEGYIEEEKTITCDITVTKANVDYTNYSISVQNAPRGLRYNIGTSSVDFACALGSSLPSSGSCLVVVTIDGTSFNKTFTWNKTRRGEDAKSLVLVGGQIIRYETPDYSDVPTPYRSTVTAKTVGLSGTPKWYVKVNGTWNLLEGQNGTELTFLHNDTTIWGNRKETTIKCELEDYEDELTLVKLASGVNGSDAITVVLTNETHTLAIDNSGYVHDSEITKAMTSILAFQGAKEVTPVLSKGVCDGCDISIKGNVVQLTSLDNSFATATAIINVNVNGITIPKTWTISKAKQGSDGATGENGSSYILNITDGTRSFTYSQINLDPRPSVSSTFVGTLYENGVEVLDGVSYYWVANGHLQGSSVDRMFTPTIAQLFDESVSNNEIQLTVTYKGNMIVQNAPISITKDANGLDWVQEWDDTKTDVRGNLILTPKLFAGSYDQENDLVTGVAIGKDVLNDGTTIGVAGYQNNKTTFLLDTDGTLMVGNPFEKDSTGLYFDGDNFTLKVNSLSIEGTDVATKNDLTTEIDNAINSAKNDIRQEVSEVIAQVDELDSYMNNALKDGILDDVEKRQLQNLYETLVSEVMDISGQYASVIGNAYLNNETLARTLMQCYESYMETYHTMKELLNQITQADDTDGEAITGFREHLSKFNELTSDLSRLLNDALTNIGENQANEIVANAKLEVKQEIDDVSDALTNLETTMNGDFKSGLVSTMNLTTLKSKLSQLETEKSDIDGQYKGIVENSKLGATSRTNLANAKGELDTAHDQLVAKINSAVSDMLMTEAELTEINRLIGVYGKKLKVYSEVAQQANADIALNLAQGAIQALNQEDIFNKLTNNGEVQGIYLENGKVYVNGEYINSRNLKAVRNDGTETFKIDSEGNVHIKANSFYLVGDDTNIADKDYVDNAIDSIVIDNVELTQEQVFNALTNNGQTQGVYLQNGKIYLNGEYLKAKSITADKLHADVLSANNIVSTINGGSTNISGNKIRTGVISSNNGKSTINLDSGAMNLGTTSDSSYLQWTGSALNIKANSINIGASSVATTTDVGNAKNEAINSANNNTANTLKDYYTKTQTDSQINIAKDAINLGVSSTYETKSNVSTQITSTLNSAKSYADTKKSEAISTASTDATNKVNSAKNELNTAIGKKANATDVYNKTETYTKTETDSKIKIAKDEINLGVSSLEEKISDVETTVTNTEIGSRNYLRNGNFTKGIQNWSTSDMSSGGANKSVTIDNNNASWIPVNKTALVIRGTNTTERYGVQSTAMNLMPNTQYTISGYCAGHRVGEILVNIRDVDASSANIATMSVPVKTGGATLDKYQRFEYTFTTRANSKYVVNLYSKNFADNGYVWFIDVMLQQGNKATQGYIVAEEDFVSDITTAKNEAITSANNALNTTIANYYTKTQTDSQINVAKNAITQSVANTYETKTDATSKINGVNSSISNLTTRMTSAESKITDTAITNTVKKNFYTKTETENAITSKGYATSTQLQQTATDFTYKFSQSGGYNLVRNGNPKPHNYQHWWVSGNANWYLGNSQNIGVQTTDTNEAYAGSATFKVEPGKTYSLNCWVHAESNTKGTDVYFIGSANDDGAYTEIHHLFTSGACSWTHVKKSFTVGSNINYGFIRIDNNGRKDTSSGSFTVVFFSEVLLVKGAEHYPQWSPNPNEIYDGITQINKDGITVSTSRGAYTRFSADGMNSYDNSNRQTLGIRNGGMTFYAYDNNEYVGYISQSAKATHSSNGVSIGISPQGEYLSLGLSSVSDPNAGFSQSSKFVIARTTIASENMIEGLNAYAHLDMHGYNINNAHFVTSNGFRLKGGTAIHFDSEATYPSTIFEDTSTGNLAVFGDNGVVMGYRNGDTNTNILKITETADGKGCKINSYQHWNFNDWTMYNMQATYDGFTRSSADSVKMFKLSSAKESNFCVQVANDYVTYFNIQANNYVDGGKYIARFHYWNGTSAGSQGIHFYRALNMHGYNITNVGNMNVLGLMSEEVVANDIKIASPYAVMSRSGEVESLSVVKTTDDMTEHNDTVTVVNGRAEVYLPIGLAHMGYLVQATPNKLVKVAVTEKLDDHFVIEVDSNEEIAVDYCIKAFQPNYVTRVATYGELQGEESPQATTAEEAEVGECDEVQYFNEITPLDYAGGDSLTIE